MDDLSILDASTEGCLPLSVIRRHKHAHNIEVRVLGALSDPPRDVDEGWTPLSRISEAVSRTPYYWRIRKGPDVDLDAGMTVRVTEPGSNVTRIMRGTVEQRPDYDDLIERLGKRFGRDRPEGDGWGWDWEVDPLAQEAIDAIRSLKGEGIKMLPGHASDCLYTSDQHFGPCLAPGAYGTQIFTGTRIVATVEGGFLVEVTQPDGSKVDVIVGSISPIEPT